MFFVAVATFLAVILLAKRKGVNPAIGPGDAKAVLRELRLPPGFKVSLYAQNVMEARSLSLGNKGTLFVGSRSAGNVYAIEDKDGDRMGETVHVLARNLFMPCGVAFRSGSPKHSPVAPPGGGSLFVAEVNRVIRYDDIENNLASPPSPVVVNDSFPSETWHGWKFIRFGPDDKLYVPVGAPCNVCDRSDDERFATIMRMNPDGTGLEIFARGIRNTVGFDWDHATKELWFTDNGRDWLGEDLPPDELNHAPRQGIHFGFPHFHGPQIPDPEFGKGKNPTDFASCAQPLGPHVAALGMRFYTGNQFPSKYRGRIFIAEHGSWNRSIKNGYRISMVTLDQGRPVAYETFAEGFKKNDTVFGRPADLEILDDGSMLVSDDFADAIYRISWGN